MFTFIKTAITVLLLIACKKPECRWIQPKIAHFYIITLLNKSIFSDPLYLLHLK